MALVSGSGAGAGGKGGTKRRAAAPVRINLTAVLVATLVLVTATAVLMGRAAVGGIEAGQGSENALRARHAGAPPPVPPPAKEEAPAAAAAAASFPSPALLAGPDAEVALRPAHGSHRPGRDAVFAFAEGYPLSVYVQFVESLRATGFAGDVVLAVASEDRLAPGVGDYLRANAGGEGDDEAMAVVSYTARWDCWKKNGEKIETLKRGSSTTNDGVSDCTLRGLYGRGEKAGAGAGAEAGAGPVADPRPARPVATARYELYWAWVTAYLPSSRILLIDVRDTYFQADPFVGLPIAPDAAQVGGTLRLYEENASPSSAAANIGASSYNSSWIRGAYGAAALEEVREKPVICSGSTLGEAVAIESYLRGMVQQFDRTKCKMKGCDQGMHNYFYYSGGLDGASEIREIVVYKQGEGVVNNLAAMRNSPLRDQSVLQEGTDLVMNWDGTASPVVHQFDRDKELSRIIQRRVNGMISRLGIK